MSIRSKAMAKTQFSPKPSFAPMQSRLLQRRTANYSAHATVPPIVQNVLRSPGQPFDPTTRTFMESRFGHDFSRVNVHNTRLGIIQTKLKINKPGDLYEEEADRVADQVMRMEEPSVRKQPDEELVQTKPVITPLIQKQTEEEEEEEEEEEFLQAKELPGQSCEVTPALLSHIQSLRGGGYPLSENDRAFFELRFGRDFSQVRVHTDTRAAETAQAVNAQAFTVGQDVIFGGGNYKPETINGKKLLAHELTHVIQQRGAAALTTFSPDNLEFEALRKKIANGATGKQIGYIREEGTDIPEVAPQLRSEHRLQRNIFDDEAEEAPDYPLAVAVQNGPPHQAINPGDLPDSPDVVGLAIAISVIPRSRSRACLGLIEDKEQVSDSFDHTGSFQGRDPLHFHGSNWQGAGRIPADKHAVPMSLIIDRAVRHGGEGSFSIHQLDIFRRRGSSRKYVIPYSGYRVVFNIVTGPGGRIDLDVQKMPEGCSVEDDEGHFRAGPGHDVSGGLNPRYSVRAVVRGAGTEELRPTGPTSRLFGYGQRAAASESHAPFVAHRGIPDAGVIEEEARDAGVPGGVEATDPGAPLPQQAQTSSFSHTTAAAYARRWALGTNPGFPRFAGNDCTNFVSQAMLEGGWTMVGGSVLDRTRDNVWWYGRSRFVRASHTWAGAQKFANFCRVSGRVTRASDPMQLNPGDVLQLEHGGHISHSMVVTGKNDTDLLLSYHTTDRLDEPLSNIRASSSPMVVFVPWRIS